MPIDSISNRMEIVDDVIIVEDYVVFATRDYRPTSLPVNLRISDTNDVLGNSDIDNQWRFYLYDYESIASEVRLLLLNKYEFVLAYIVYNSKYDNYHLCTHKINLSDFLQGVNTIISHEVEIDKRCSNLVDLIYEPDVQTMVILLNGEKVSELYHADPFLTTTSTIYKLDHRGKSLYSIDTIGNYYLLNSDMYVAIGDSTLFYQDISNGSVIEESCLTITPVRYILQDQPEIEFVNDPLERYQDFRNYDPYSKVATYFYGTRTCRILDN